MAITYINDTRLYPYEGNEWSVSIVTGPTQEPVSVDDLQAQARIDYTGDQQDTLLGYYISAAREWAEVYCERSFAQKTLQLTIDHFPWDCEPIHLPFPVVQSVVSLQYLYNCAWITLDPSLYQIDLSVDDPRLAPYPNSQGWPTTDDKLAAVKVQYTVGPTAIPASAKVAILMVAADMWKNRETQLDTQQYKNPVAESLLSSLRTFTQANG